MASILRAVASSSSSSIDSANPANDISKRLAKWALVIGVPTAVCVAAYLVYRQQQDLAKKSATRRSPLPTPLTSITGTTIQPTPTKAAGDTLSSSNNRTKVTTQLTMIELGIIKDRSLESFNSSNRIKK